MRFSVEIIGICGSPRRGNSEWLLETTLQEVARLGAEVETLLLRKMDIRMYRGCLSCEKGGDQRPGVCSIHDEMAAVYPELLEADALVLATPGYFEILSGLLKNSVPALSGQD
jgi:multimeric flavodoxin WrbA